MLGCGTLQQDQTGFASQPPWVPSHSVNPHSCVEEDRPAQGGSCRAQDRLSQGLKSHLCCHEPPSPPSAQPSLEITVTQSWDPNASVLLVGLRVFGTRRGWTSRMQPLDHALEHNTMANEQF